MLVRIMLWMYFTISVFLGNLEWKNGIGNSVLEVFAVHHLLSIILVQAENDPELIVPDNVCIFFDNTQVELSGKGDVNDVFTWEVRDPEGTLIFDRGGGADNYQRLTLSVSKIGRYHVKLSVRRGTQVIYDDEKSFVVNQGPTFVLESDYLKCNGLPVQITAIDPATPNLDAYTFEWTNSDGTVIGNTNQITTDQEGYISVVVFLTNVNGDRECEINGTTYIGPPDEFDLEIVGTPGCFGEVIDIRPNTPLKGSWYYLKNGEHTREFITKAYELQLDTESDLDGPGDYQLIFEVPYKHDVSCNSQRTINIKVNPLPDFEVTAVPTLDCYNQNGKILLRAITDVENWRIEELDLDLGGILAGETSLVSDLGSGIYTVSASNAHCSGAKVAVVERTDEINDNNFDIHITPELCTDTGTENGSIKLQANVSGYEGNFRLLGSKGELIANEDFTGSFEIEVASGTYYLGLDDNVGCLSGYQSTIIIDQASKVDFSVPSSLNVCQSLELIPEATQELLFLLTSPSGRTFSAVTGESFTIDEEGEYTLLGRPADSNSGNCPRQVTFKTTFVEDFEFEPVLVSVDCFGGQYYEVNLFGQESSQYLFRWYDQDRKIVGRREIYHPGGYGQYFLEVQPKHSGFCPSEPIAFDISPMVTSVDVTLEATPVCPESLTAQVTVETDTAYAKQIDWIYISLDNQIERLPQFQDRLVIDVTEEGTYEAVVIGERNCELGRANIPVFRSLDETRPTVEPEYSICTRNGQKVTITPGEFESYHWYKAGKVVHEGSAFRPSSAGNYTVELLTSEGCLYVKEFEVKDECISKYSMPNAMYISDQENDFRVYFSSDVEYAEIWIHSRQGELIHYCSIQHPDEMTPHCNWDGIFNGKESILGTYTVTVAYKARSSDLVEETKPLMILGPK